MTRAERRGPERHRDGPSGQRHVLAGRAAAGQRHQRRSARAAALAGVGGSSSPTSLLTYSAPASNDAVSLTFSQAIGANEALRTGSYSKSLTFTLSTTTP